MGRQQVGKTGHKEAAKTSKGKKKKKKASLQDELQNLSRIKQYSGVKQVFIQEGLPDS